MIGFLLVAIPFAIYCIFKFATDPEARSSSAAPADDDDKQKWEDYCENHYFDIFNECWVKQYPSGDYVKSCSFEDLQAGRADDQGPISVTYCIPADEYSDDPDWLDNKREHWRQWTNLWRDDPP